MNFNKKILINAFSEKSFAINNGEHLRKWSNQYQPSLPQYLMGHAEWNNILIKLCTKIIITLGVPLFKTLRFISTFIGLELFNP